MEVLIKGKLTNLTPERIEALHPTFSLLHGRQFNLQDDCGKVSLNNLISAVKDAALKNKQNLSEVEEILRVFKAIENKGYDFSNNDISQENFLIRTITKIKHFSLKSLESYF
ncbi:MAG: hypothetical protein HWD61_03040 [Parachlamydiaceae bacterium]|nr:MAG: hypothetical protein HWD61_03040 [Parachlamydiaceae bacterium]